VKNFAEVGKGRFEEEIVEEECATTRPKEKTQFHLSDRYIKRAVSSIENVGKNTLRKEPENHQGYRNECS